MSLYIQYYYMNFLLSKLEIYCEHTLFILNEIYNLNILSLGSEFKDIKYIIRLNLILF